MKFKEDWIKEYSISPVLPKNPPLVSIVLLCYNDLHYIQYVLPNLLEVTEYPNYEIILIDNGSRDTLDKWIEKNFQESSNISYYKLPKNIGFGKGMNIGMKKAKGKYLICCNTDIILKERWLFNLVLVAESDDNIGLIGYSILTLNFKKWNFPITKEILYRSIDIIDFPVFLFRKSLSTDNIIGLFDRFYFLYYEDIDLIYRTHLKGYKVVLVKNSYYYHGRFLEETNRKKISSEFSIVNKYQIMMKSRVYFYTKWFPLHYLFKEFLEIFFSILYLIYKKEKYKVLGMMFGLNDVFKEWKFVLKTRIKLKNDSNLKKTMKYIIKMQKWHRNNPIELLKLKFDKIMPEIIFQKLKKKYKY